VGELLTSGTRAPKTKQQIDEQVDGMGATLAGSSDGLYGSSLKKHFSHLMDLVYEVNHQRQLPAEGVRKAKTAR